MAWSSDEHWARASASSVSKWRMRPCWRSASRPLSGVGSSAIPNDYRAAPGIAASPCSGLPDSAVCQDDARRARATVALCVGRAGCAQLVGEWLRVDVECVHRDDERVDDAAYVVDRRVG